MVRLKISPIFSIFFFIRPPWPKPFSHIHLSSWIFCLRTPRWRCAVQPRLESWKFKSNKTSSLLSPCAFRILSRIDFIFSLQHIWGNLLLRCVPSSTADSCRLRAIPPHTGWHQLYVSSSFSFSGEWPPLEVKALTTSRRSHHTSMHSLALSVEMLYSLEQIKQQNRLCELLLSVFYNFCVPWLPWCHLA